MIRCRVVSEIHYFLSYKIAKLTMCKTLTLYFFIYLTTYMLCWFFCLYNVQTFREFGPERGCYNKSDCYNDHRICKTAVATSGYKCSCTGYKRDLAMFPYLLYYKFQSSYLYIPILLSHKLSAARFQCCTGNLLHSVIDFLNVAHEYYYRKYC
jgi:hypothetical protein